MWRQLGLTWLAGSAITGTLAVLFTSDTRGMLFSPLEYLPDRSLVTLAVLLFALAVALLAIGWRTQHASWLPNGGRACCSGRSSSPAAGSAAGRSRPPSPSTPSSR